MFRSLPARLLRARIASIPVAAMLLRVRQPDRDHQVAEGFERGWGRICTNVPGFSPTCHEPAQSVT